MTKLRFLLAAVVVGAFALSLGTQTGAAKKQRKVSAPVIHENFTLLPCSGAKNHRTTLQIEGCGEHAVLRSDSQIDKLNARIFAKLSSSSAKKQFVDGHNAWLTYRHKYCLSMSAPYSGGTLSGVVYINCVSTLDAQHVQELNGFLKSLKPS